MTNIWASYSFEKIKPFLDDCFPIDDLDDWSISHDLIVMDSYFDSHPEDYEKALEWKENIKEQFEKYKNEYIKHYGKKDFAYMLESWIRFYKMWLSDRPTKKRYFWWDFVFDEYKKLQKYI